MGVTTGGVACLFSHRCADEAHKIGERLRGALRPFGIGLHIDPFRVGDDVAARMQTFDIEAVVFLSSTESVASRPVLLELKSARRQCIPIFTIHLEGPVPKSLKKRLYWDIRAISSWDDPGFAAGVVALATSLNNRVAFNRKLHVLQTDSYFHDSIAAARSIATEADRNLVAESASELARRYLKLSDPTTRYWIALALGRANTPESERLLEGLPTHDHPLVLEGIRQAREMIHV